MANLTIDGVTIAGGWDAGITSTTVASITIGVPKMETINSFTVEEFNEVLAYIRNKKAKKEKKSPQEILQSWKK